MRYERFLDLKTTGVSIYPLLDSDTRIRGMKLRSLVFLFSINRANTTT